MTLPHRAVVFDPDGTLVQSERLTARSCAQTANAVSAARNAPREHA